MVGSSVDALVASACSCAVGSDEVLVEGMEVLPPPPAILSKSAFSLGIRFLRILSRTACDELAKCTSTLLYL